MTDTVSGAPTPVQIPVVIDNLADWTDMAKVLASDLSVQSTITPELITQFVGSAVKVLFSIGSIEQIGLARGVVSDHVLNQFEHLIGQLSGTPVAVTVHLVSTPEDGDHYEVRIHVGVRVNGGNAEVVWMVWDLMTDAAVAVAPSTCPNCGAPLENGVLICPFCHASVLPTAARSPLQITRLETY
jgi:hypothetical protein